jgi:hypothetical protein
MSPSESEGDLNELTRSGLARRITVPPVVALLLVFLYIVAEALGYRGLARPEGDTAAEAAAFGSAARTLQLIAAGENPNQPLHVRAGTLDGSEHRLRPLEAAVLARHAELVRLLVRTGAARFDTTRAVCFARARLPEVLPDLGGSHSGPAEPIDMEAAFSMCGTD